MDKASFETFKSRAEKNRMFIRASRFKRLNYGQAKEVRGAIKRSKEAYEKIYEIQKEFEREDVPFVIFKTLNNHPDMGLDVDFLVRGDDIEKVESILFEKFHGKRIGQSIASTLVGKVSITIEDSPIIVEPHKDKFSQIGESSIPGAQMIRNSVIVKLFGKNYRVPSNEDELLITVIHRVYRHMSVRFSDVYNVRNMMEKEKLNWAYILKNAEKVGILSGLLILLDLAEKYGGNIDSMRKFPYFISKRDFVRIYFGKIKSDFIHARAGSLIRMTTIYPFLLILEALFGKYLVNKFW